MLCFSVSNKRERTRFRHESGPIELGRQPKLGGPEHVVQDPYVSASQLLVEELPGDRVRIMNLSQKVKADLANGTPIEPCTSCELDLPVRLTVGATLIEIAPEGSEEGSVEEMGTIARPISFGGATRPLGATASPPAEGGASGLVMGTGTSDFAEARPEERVVPPLAGLDETPQAEQLARWFERVVAVQRAAASSNAFFEETARAVVELIGLDRGLVLSRKDRDWKVEAGYPPDAHEAFIYSKTILERVCQERRTFFRMLGPCSTTESLWGVNAVVASPVFNTEGTEVIGVVYGARLRDITTVVHTGRMAEISPLEAQLVQVLAAAVGAGLARRESELEAMRRSVQFEQFFSCELARELDRDASMLEGRIREVTILVSDIRGFSRLAERLGPRETCLMMNQVLERLTTRIFEQGGVVVDYVGDGILAMWNAPVDQPDHSARACRAAMLMQAELPELNARWRDRIGGTLALGIGINTGEALVGNTGSLRKFKYGPLGHTVNLASRVEGATKQIGIPTLITGTTHAPLGGTFATRRLCTIRVVGIERAIDLHELHAIEPDPEWRARAEEYEKALSSFEARRWSEACRTLAPLLAGQEGNYDLPALTLLGRAIECLKTNPTDFDPVLAFTIK